MAHMNACEWLDNIKKLDQLIDSKIEERERLISIATDISAKPFDGMPHSNTGMVSQRMQNAVCELVDLEQETQKIINKYIQCKKEIIATIEKLPEKEYGVLHRYYIRHMTIEAIAEDMGLCTVQIWRIKKKALKSLSNVIECNAQKEL